MQKVIRNLMDTISKGDMIIEVVDARAPDASSNPILHGIARNKLTIKILSKSDLADPQITKKWIKFYKKKAISTNMINDGDKNTKAIISICRKYLPHCGTIFRPLNIIVLGMPNVGKSTLINSFIRRKVTKTGNEPGITKKSYKFKIDRCNKYFYLVDTPGIIFNKSIDIENKSKLIAIGSLRDVATNYIEAASFIITILKRNYPKILDSRYRISECSRKSVKEILALIGSKIGQKHIHQTAGKVIVDFRQRRLNRISLENPD